MSITIERPKDIDLEEFFELKLWMAPVYGVDIVLPKKRIVIGQREARWEKIEVKRVRTDGLVLLWKNKAEYIPYDSGSYVLRRGDTLVVNMTWHIDE